jgi:hypothetical protein
VSRLRVCAADQGFEQNSGIESSPLQKVKREDITRPKSNEVSMESAE